MMTLMSDVMQARMADLVKRRPHAIGLYGSLGSGKHTVARELAAQLLGVSSDALSGYPYFYDVIPAKKDIITVEELRELLGQMKMTVPGAHETRRIVLIADADKVLRSDAQNVLLKFIEEPPAGTCIILTYADETAMLPTIRSRVQAVSLVLPLRDELTAYFTEQGHESTAIARAYALSGGLPGMMSALLASDQAHPLLGAVAEAKKILAADTFQRLTMIDALAKSDLDSLFFAFRQIARTSLSSAAEKGQSDAVLRRWTQVLQLSQQAETWRSGHVQNKLLLTNFMLQL